MTETSPTNQSDQSIVRELAKEMLEEKRSSRKWSNFFKCLMYFYIGVVLLALIFGSFRGAKEFGASGAHLALIPFNGTIAANGDVNAAEMNGLLESAFESKLAKGVVLEINSPGGSPVQSESIFNKIRALRAEYPDKKLYAVVSDVCASGSYYVAAAADEIYVARASIVGSIGVRMDSFGVTELMDKVGVESRTITAGENKAIFSPFDEVNPTHVAHLEKLIAQVHEQFIGDVRSGRGDRLTEVEGLFSGLFWTGEEALKIGLADGLGDADFIAKEKYEDLKLVRYEPARNLFEELTQGVGASVSAGIEKALRANTNSVPVMN